MCVKRVDQRTRRHIAAGGGDKAGGDFDGLLRTAGCDQRVDQLGLDGDGLSAMSAAGIVGRGGTDIFEGAVSIAADTVEEGAIPESEVLQMLVVSGMGALDGGVVVAQGLLIASETGE